MTGHASAARPPHPARAALKTTFLFGLFLLLPVRNGAAQSINGTTGLVTIPTAELLDDGVVVFGANYVDKEYNVRSRDDNQHRYFITLGYLPFLEVSLRLTRNYMMRLDNHPMQWPGDRGASVRLRVLREKGIRPSLVLGAHDFLSAFGGTRDETVWFNALYIAGTRKIKPDRFPVTFGMHMGYGTDWMKAKHHEFTGFFGGVSAEYGGFSTFMLEYDGEKMNGGMQFVLFRHFQMMMALLNMDSFSGGASFIFTI
jgi:hypothetical protein